MRSARFTLDGPLFRGLTGKGVVVAVVDSGVHPSNPHVSGTSVVGVRIGGSGETDNDFLDRIGHGTAVAAAILEKSPAIELLAVRVFGRTLATSAEVLARGIAWAADNGADLINLSLGTSNPRHAEVLGAAVDDALARRAIVVSALESGGVTWLPGSLPNVAAVTLDPTCGRGELSVRFAGTEARAAFGASGYPRPIPGVPPERNLSGVSFAVANVTGFLARFLEGASGVRDPRELGRALCAEPAE